MSCVRIALILNILQQYIRHSNRFPFPPSLTDVLGAGITVMESVPKGIFGCIITVDNVGLSRDWTKSKVVGEPKRFLPTSPKGGVTTVAQVVPDTLSR